VIDLRNDRELDKFGAQERGLAENFFYEEKIELVKNILGYIYIYLIIIIYKYI